MFGSTPLTNDSCSKIALKRCKAIDGRWNKKCPSLSSEETNSFLWSKLIIIIIIIIYFILFYLFLKLHTSYTPHYL